MLMKFISVSVIIILLFPLSAKSLDTKTLGKLTMVGILSATALVFKILVSRDQRDVNELHKSLGQPDRIIEYEDGFDHWRLEWYGDKVYYFRNGIISEPSKLPILLKTE